MLTRWLILLLITTNPLRISLFSAKFRFLILSLLSYFLAFFFKYAIIYLHSVAFACFVSMITLPDIRTILFISLISLCTFHMQPGYLHNLIPDSAPHHPESLQNILDGEVIQSVSYNLKLLGKKEKKSFF